MAFYGTQLKSQDWEGSTESILQRLEKRLHSTTNPKSESKGREYDLLEKKLKFNFPELAVDGRAANDEELQSIGIEISKIEAQIQLLNGDVKSLKQQLHADFSRHSFVEIKILSDEKNPPQIESLEVKLNSYPLIKTSDFIDPSALQGETVVYTGPLLTGAHKLSISAIIKSQENRDVFVDASNAIRIEGEASLLVPDKQMRNGFKILLPSKQLDDEKKLNVESYEI